MKDRIILAEKLIVPSCMVPFGATEDYKATVKGRTKDDEEQHFEFFRYEPITECHEFARGNQGLFKKHFASMPLDDQRSRAMMGTLSIPTPQGNGLKFVGSLKREQQDVVDALLKTDLNGLLDAPPRFGKTITLVYLTCHLKMKTLFLAHNVDLSKQMLASFRKFSNALDLEYTANRRVVDIVEDWDDLYELDVAIMTYQSFTSNDKAWKKLATVKNVFGAVFVDEVHKATARTYTAVVSSFNSAVRIGVTGTVQRKDGMHVQNEFIFGPVLAEGRSNQVPTQVRVVKTGLNIGKVPGNPKMFFNKVHDLIMKDDVRTDLIVSFVKAYVDAGHYCFVVADRTAHIESMVRKLKGLGIPAAAYHGKSFKSQKHRDKCLDECREGKTKVLVANRTMTVGIDLPRFSAFFCASPSANAPNYYQELCRVRTVYPGKHMAYIVDFVDNHHILEACLGTRKKVYNEENFEITYG